MPRLFAELELAILHSFAEIGEFDLGDDVAGFGAKCDGGDVTLPRDHIADLPVTTLRERFVFQDQAW